MSFDIYLRFRNVAKYVLIIWTLFGFTVYDVIYFMAILNYVVQSEMLFHIIHMIRKKVITKKYNNFDNVLEASP